MNDAVHESISADLPLTDPVEDRLGYAPFAARLADAISALKPDQTMVLALHGAWGSGKTSLLNFVAHHLEREPDGEDVGIVRFNPWRYSPADDLAVRLIDELRSALGGEGGEALASTLDDLAALLSGQRVAAPDQWRHGDVPLALEAARSAVARELRQCPRLVVLVDDVDRLEAQQLTELFRAIRGVGDFANVVYLLAFDDRVARHTLSDSFGIDGGQYLEKMVQTAFEIPDLERSLLRGLFFESIDRVLLEEERAGRLDVRYWGNVYWDGLDHFIATPRHVKRLTNALAIAYPGISGEVNVVDLIAIEALRMFVPDVYETVRAHPHLFTGRSPHVRDPEDAEKVRAHESFHQEWIEQVPSVDREAVTRLMKRVFPRLAEVWDSTFYGPEIERTWRREARVASEENFPVYFRFAVPPGRVSRREFEAFVRSADDRATLDRRLLDVLGAEPSMAEPRARSLLGQIADLDVIDIKAPHAARLFTVLLDRGDDILQLDTTALGSFEFEMSVLLGRAFRFLLSCLADEERTGFLLRCVDHTTSLASPAVLYDTLVEDFRSGGDGAVLQDREAHARLEVATIEQIREGARSAELVTAPQLPTLLTRWADVAGTDTVGAWCSRVARDDAAFRQLIAGLARPELRLADDDVASVTTIFIDEPALTRFVTRPDLVEWARDQLASGAGTGRERAALRAVCSRPASA